MAICYIQMIFEDTVLKLVRHKKTDAACCHLICEVLSQTHLDRERTVVASGYGRKQELCVLGMDFQFFRSDGLTRYQSVPCY